MSCKAYRAEIEEAEQGAPLSEGASAHVRSCPACRTFSNEQATLKHMIGNLEVVAAPADFDFRLRARLATLKSEANQNGFGWHSFAPGARALALAASFVLLITIGLVVRQAWRAPANNTASQGVANLSPVSPAVNAAPAIIQTNSKPETVVSPVAAPPESLAFHRRASNRNVGELPVPTTGIPDNKEAVSSVDIGVTNAPPTITPPGITTRANALMAVPVEASMKTTRVMLNDGRARMQSVSLRPVTFGAQDIVEQKSGQKELVSDAQSIW